MDRPRRRLVRRWPKASHYVGYVDDNETAEMIMKKFEVLDKIMEDTRGQQNVKIADSGQELTETQLETVFKMTSSLKFDSEENSASFDQADYEFNSEDQSDNGDESDNEEDTMSLHEDLIQDCCKNKASFAIRRGKKSIENLVQNESHPIYHRLPSVIPFPPTVAKTVLPYIDPNSTPLNSKYIETEIKSFDWKLLNQTFTGVILDVPWASADASANSNPYAITCEELSALPIESLVNCGFLFIWVEKEHISSCLKIANNWNFAYAEHLTWVQQNVDYSIQVTPHKIFNKVKLTLLIFKKGDLPIRHQRNVDVVFDVVRKGRFFTVEKPLQVYRIIEMMLFSNNSQTQPKFLEIWGKKNYRRKNWTMIVQEEPQDYLYLPVDDSGYPIECETRYYL